MTHLCEIKVPDACKEVFDAVLNRSFLILDSDFLAAMLKDGAEEELVITDK